MTTAPAGTDSPSLSNTNTHYDLDPDIFGLFLDPLRKYSSGLYRSPSDTLEQAQLNKLAFVADRLGVSGGERVLDAGCGWGSVILHFAKEYGCSTLGVSPAGKQHAYIAERAAQLGVSERVSSVVGHFEEVELPEGGYDAVTMLGSIVHMPDLEAVLSRARRLLRRGGRLYVSESCFRSEGVRAEFDERAGTQFVRDSIFGYGELRPLSELVRGAENVGFSIQSLDDLTADYHRTIEDWIVNVRERAERIDAVRPGMAEHLERYLEVANAGWGYTTKHYALVCRKGR
ncbi:methyltransferase domain-containing protein [Streptomyces sp. AJS327]|uniref:SAM-dependent methyltransferase n=1 Tax=Streptomyces sp. AJS327 TaxID=2545265 RepID=UPI0015DFD62B|nr:class I SAM-dependent methyltransferase [Streptomyces sp. AJS327]MBA0052702.1 methyltransferase domain-containing protein [Streptomyces sp. AJS327]